MNEAVMKKYSFFDTLAYAKELINAGFTEKQAEVLAKKQAELIEDQLVTKQHLDFALAKQKAELIKWMFGALTAQTIIIISVISMFKLF
jgi:hypothetical protein